MRQFVQFFRCYVWSEERGKVVEFSPVSNQNIPLSSNILSYWNMYWKKNLNPITTKYWKLTNLRAMRRILVLPLELALPPSWGRSAGEVSQGDISQLDVTNHHLWQEWEHEQPGLGRRGGREGQEDQGAGGHSQEAKGAHGDLAGGQCFHHDQSIIFIFLVFSGKCSWQKITTNPTLSKNPTRSQIFEHIFGNLGRDGGPRK